MRKKRRWVSFSLVELLVSLAVFSLLVLLLFSIMDNGIKLWRQQTSKDESFREARAALTIMSRDMSAGLLSTNSAWFYFETNSVGTNRLAFLTTLPDSAQGTTVDRGDICAVGYSLEWGTNDASGYQTNMSLYRYVSFSDPTYSSIIQGSSPIESIFDNPDGINIERDLIARNVSQFTFTAYTNDASGTTWPCPSPTSLSNVMLDVSITALNDRVAAQLTTQAQWANTNSTLFQQNEETFALRVRPQGP